MKSMIEVVAEAAARRDVVGDVSRLIDDEVGKKSGLTGMAMIPRTVDGLLDEFCGAIEPLHAEYRDADASGSFASFLQGRSNDAVNALLSITDGRAQRTRHKVLKKTYQKLRPMAEKNVVEALPGVGRVIDRHCG